MSKIFFNISIFCLLCARVTSGAMKPVSSMRNSLGDFEATRDSEIRFSEEVVGKLGEIANVMRDGNQANLEVATKNGVEMLRMIRTQEERLFELESKLNKVVAACQGGQREEEQEEELANLRQNLSTLEERLNETSTENEKLKERLDKLEKQSQMEVAALNETEILLQRTPRNFLSSTPDVIAFDAFRNKPFHTAQTYVTFDGTNVNTGNAFDPATGIFRAPRAGIYAFSFHALTQDGRATYVKIVQNGKNVGGAYRRHEGEGDESHDASINTPILRRAEGMLAQSVILDLAKGDQVQVFAYHGNLRDGGWHYTHFNGFLIQ